MWSPPALENNRQFVALARVFETTGAPHCSPDFARGFFLMEDLGSLHLSDAYQSAAGDAVTLQRLVDTALDALLPLQDISDANIPPYDEARMTMEFDLCAEWFARGFNLHLGLQTPALLQTPARAWCMRCLNSPQPAFNDYHCRNLLRAAKQANRTDRHGGLSGRIDWTRAVRPCIAAKRLLLHPR